MPDIQELNIQTEDNYRIVATQFTPDIDNGKTVLISAATGVAQRFYVKFATYLAQNGYTVFTYDFRGIGKSKHQGSLRGLKATYFDWSAKDMRAVADYAAKTFPNHKNYLIGHSFGGNSIGLTPASVRFDGIVTVAAQFGYWRNFQEKSHTKLVFLFKFLMPTVSHILGYFPSKRFGLGENLPKQAALDWCLFMMHPQSQLAYAKQYQSYYVAIKCPMLIISIDDDWMAPKKAVDMLAEKLYPNAQQKRVHIVPKDYGAEAIGHMDFFRPKFEQSLWAMVGEWLNK
jgi:predicted alpha/beta hydrolase